MFAFSYLGRPRVLSFAKRLVKKGYKLSFVLLTKPPKRTTSYDEMQNVHEYCVEL